MEALFLIVLGYSFLYESKYLDVKSDGTLY